MIVKYVVLCYIVLEIACYMFRSIQPSSGMTKRNALEIYILT